MASVSMSSSAGLGLRDLLCLCGRGRTISNHNNNCNAPIEASIKRSPPKRGEAPPTLVRRASVSCNTMASSRELYNFLLEAELEHYHNALRNELKITSSHQLKYVKEEDLIGIGMSKPEMRRLKKYYKKEYPQGIEKIYRAIKKTGESSSSRALSPPPPEHRLSRPSYIRGPGKQIIPSECLAIHKTLGEGEFGVVQQGIWTTEDGERVQVAIKCLSKEKMLSAMADFLKEAGMMQSIDHDHMVRMFGVVLDKENTLMLVTELAPMRSLLECLKEPSLRLDFPIPRLCDFAQQICDGMSYLESKRFIHRDLAARNVLVFSKNQVKISDFGLSRALGVGKDYYQTKFTSTLKLPIAWCAPESITYLKFTSASDSWSYAVTLWEMFTYGFQPWAGLTGQQILETIDKPKSQRLEKPDLCPKEYYDLMMKCWEHECTERPSFSQVFIKLPQIRPMLVKAVKDYPSPVVQKDYLFYKAYDVVIVLDRNPDNPPEPGLWKGVLNTGRSGYFDPTNTVPFVEPKTSPIERHKPSIVRRESARKSGRRLRADMIGKPMDDLRHTGHIGYDGAIFGDVSFIGDNVDKLPVRHGNAGSPADDTRGSSISLPRYADSPERNFSVRNSQSELSLGIGANGIGHSWMSKESLDSRATLDTYRSQRDGEKTPPYQDIDDDLDNFKFPDLSTSLDLGPSFMDEVFAALKEHASPSEDNEPPTPTPSTTPNNFTPTAAPVPAPKPRPMPKPTPSRREAPQATVTLPEPREVSRSSFLQEERQTSSTKEFTAPPLPAQPPRVDVKREIKHEVTKKQAKVKPLSASDERMINDAITMANEISSQVTNSQMKADSPPVQMVPIWPDSPQVDTKSSPESPKLIDRLKHSLKRSSPKSDRKRTFSEELENKSEMSDDFPPESQEAYNILVVRGADNDKEDQIDAPSDQDSLYQHKKYGQVEVKPVSRLPNGNKSTESYSIRLSDRYHVNKDSYKTKISEPYNSKISEPYSSRVSEPYSSKASESYTSKISEPYSSKASESYSSKTSEQNSIKISEPYSSKGSEPYGKISESYSATTSDLGKSKVSETFINKVSSESFNSKVSEPISVASRIPEPSSRLSEQTSSKIQEPVISRIPEPTSRSYSSKPVPRPRVELKKPSEPPPPRPRPEVQRVEPTVRSTPTGSADPHRFLKPASKPPKAELEDLDDKELNSSVGDLKRSSRADNSSLSSSSSVEREIEKSKAEESREKTKSFGFEEEFSEPSPREIMSRLRESKMRRSVDHQSGDVNEPPTPPRNLREPQGIPGRKGSAASTNDDDEEQDTNPLRMLRGGAIPIRGSRGPAGEDKATDLTIPARQPLLPMRKRRLLSDSSALAPPIPRPPRRPTRSLSYDPSESPPPPVPPRRSSSFEHSPANQVPLPPRRPMKPVTLNTKPRERKHPLTVNIPSPHVTPPKVTSPKPHNPFTSPLKPIFDPYADLPPAPPPPLTPTEEAKLDSEDEDVFLPASPKPLSPKVECDRTWRHSGSSTFPRRKFRLNNLKYDLEDLGFYDTDDPFWVQKVALPKHEHVDYPINNNNNKLDSRSGKISPVPCYKTSDNVSYEDLLEFALDREKDCEEIETMRKVFHNDVSAEDCQRALEETHWDVYNAIKYIKLKQLLSLQLGDVTVCKNALMRHEWSVQRALDFLLSRPPSSPEVICV